MSEDERILRLENAISTLAELAAEQQRLSEEQQRQAAEQQRLMSDQQRRTARLEESLVTLVQLIRSHDESIDELKAARAEAERKFAGLADAMKELAEAQAHADRRVDALVDIVREWRKGRG
jgi:chromosome segregation ATPase